MPLERKQSENRPRRVLLIGWDAADWQLIQPLIKKGLMPTTAALLDRGAWGNLATTRPILSPVDASGRAIRNGISGNSSTLLDLQVQYVLNLPGAQTAGFFWEIYNALNRENLGNPTGNRNNRNFMVPVEAGTMRSMQLGVRYTF